MNRLGLLACLLLATAVAALAYGDPHRIADAKQKTASVVGAVLSDTTGSIAVPRAVEVPRGNGGEFALRATVNGVPTPMVIDTGATSVVLTWETARAIGLPLDFLSYDVDVETAGGTTRAARLTLDRLAIGPLVERAVPALVVPRGQMRANLLGMSFLDRLESWEVRPDKLKLRGYP